MLRKDEGVVLSSTRRGESSKLVTFLGRESGKIRLLAKAAMSPKSPFRGALEPGTYVEVLFYYKDARSFYYLKEVTVHSAVDVRGGELARVASTLAMLELLEQVCYWGHPEQQILDVVREFLEAADIKDPLLFLLALEFKLLEVLGILPDFGRCSECGAASIEGYFYPEDGASACAGHSRPSPHRIKLTGSVAGVLMVWSSTALCDLARGEVEAAVRKRLGKILHWTYTFHINGYSLPEALKLIPKGSVPKGN